MGQIINNIQGPPAGGQLINNQLEAGFALLQNGTRIPYVELPGYTQDSDLDSNSARRVLMTDWTNVDSFPVAMLGDVAVGQGGFLSRSLPDRHPSKPFMYCKSVRLREGRGAFYTGDTGTIAYKDFVNNIDGAAVFDVEYADPDYPIMSDVAIAAAAVDGTFEFHRFVSYDTQEQAETLGLPGQAFKWLSDNAPIVEGLSIQREVQEVHYRWRWVPETTINNLRFKVLPQTVGRCNVAAFDGYQPQTALCAPPQFTRLKHTPSGNPIRDVEFVLLVRLDGTTWNQFYRPKAKGFDTAIPGNLAAQPPFPTADFNQLFKAA